LRGDEVPFYRLVEAFNTKAQASRIVLINQFGWNRERCGERMPEEMTDNDIRWGTDLEFGQSIYEPFGISQMEPLGYGALVVLSSVCGCLGFVRQVTKVQIPENIIVSDYVTLPEGMLAGGYRSTQHLGQVERDQIETIQAQRVAQEVMTRLPTTKRARKQLLKSGYQLSQQMSWDLVVQQHLLPALVHAASS
jgi:glycogen synthase